MVGALDAVTSELSMAAGFLRDYSVHPGMPKLIGTISERLLTEVAVIDGHLAATLAAWIVELEKFRRE